VGRPERCHTCGDLVIYIPDNEEVHMQYNEFTRRLHHCHIDEDTKFLLAYLYESNMEHSRQLDICANLLSMLVKTVGEFTVLHETTQEKVKSLLRQDAEVHSVRNDPEDGR